MCNFLYMKAIFLIMDFILSFLNKVFLSKNGTMGQNYLFKGK